MNPPLYIFPVAQAVVQVYPTKSDMSYAAAVQVSRILQHAISRRGRARIIIATRNSPLDFIRILTQFPDLKWECEKAFHMDEYVGISEYHPASFRRWVKTRWADVVHPGRMHYLQGDAPDLDEECRRYGEWLGAASMDACFLGFGENGQIAFNDPYVADLEDRRRVKRFDLGERCRHQQLGEEHFPTLESVPHKALDSDLPHSDVCWASDLLRSRGTESRSNPKRAGKSGLYRFPGLAGAVPFFRQYLSESRLD